MRPGANYGSVQNLPGTIGVTTGVAIPSTWLTLPSLFTTHTLPAPSGTARYEPVPDAAPVENPFAAMAVKVVPLIVKPVNGYVELVGVAFATHKLPAPSNAMLDGPVAVVIPPEYPMYVPLTIPPNVYPVV